MSAWERPAPPRGGDEWLRWTKLAPKKARLMTVEEVESLVQAAMDRHAHELAEKIRREAEIRVGWGQPMRAAADLIDPEVE